MKSNIDCKNEHKHNFFTSRIKQSNETLIESIEGKKIYSKKNIFFLFFFFVLSLVLIALAFSLVLKIDVKQFFGAINNGFNRKIGYALFVCFCLEYLWSIAYAFLGFYPRLSKININIPTWEYIIFSLTIAFFKGITPPSIFIDPYTMFWLKTKGLSTDKATSIVITNSLTWQAAALTVTLPSFIYLWTINDGFIKLVQNRDGWFTLITVILGMGFNFLCFFGWFILCWSKKIHFILSRVGNWIKKKFGMKYHTKEQIEQKYQIRATMRNNFINLIKDWKISLICFVLYVGFEIYLYLCICFGMIFTQENTNINFYMAFNCANVAVTANTIFFFIPGGILTLDKFLKDLLTLTNCWKNSNVNEWEKERITINSIFLWRWFYTYLPTLTGTIGAIPLITIQLIQYKNKKKLRKNVK